MTFQTNVRGIFIAGTGTGVGKTLITAGVLRRLQAHAPEAIVMKPMQTGAEPVPGQGLAAPDVDFVLRAADLTVDKTETWVIDPVPVRPGSGRTSSAEPTKRLITLVTCGLGSVIGLIEGIIYLTKTDPEFYQTYMVERRAWF